MKINLINLIPVTIICIAFVVSLVKHYKIKSTPLRYFTYLLGVTFITEVFAVILHSRGNLVVYNVFIFIVNLFYFWFYKKFYKGKLNKELMNVFIVVFILVYLWELVILKKNFYHSSFFYSLVTGAIFISITVILYLIEIIKDDKILDTIYKSMLFWISIGSLIFYVGIIPIFINSAFLHYKNTYYYIISPLNIIMYSCFITGYLVSKKKTLTTTTD